MYASLGKGDLCSKVAEFHLFGLYNETVANAFDGNDLE